VLNGVNNDKQAEIHTAKSLVPSNSSSSEVEIANEKLKTYKLPGIDEIPAELIQAGSNTLRSDIFRVINCVRNKEELPQEWKEYIIVPIY
jgi:hypothetical protein